MTLFSSVFQTQDKVQKKHFESSINSPLSYNLLQTVKHKDIPLLKV